MMTTIESSTGATVITRTRTWDTRELDQFLRSHANTPFAWGICDCCLFAAGAVLAMTGVDIAKSFRGQYSSQATAMQAIKTIAGGASVEDAISWCAAQAQLVEWTRASDKTPVPLFAKRGDLVAVRNGDGEIIGGIVDLSGAKVAAMGVNGIVRLPITNAVRAWHIPAK